MNFHTNMNLLSPVFVLMAMILALQGEGKNFLSGFPEPFALTIRLAIGSGTGQVLATPESQSHLKQLILKTVSSE